MLIPLFLTLFSHNKPIRQGAASHAPRHKAAARPRLGQPRGIGRPRTAKQVKTAVKGEIQLVMLAPPGPPTGPPAALGLSAALRLSASRRLMPLTAALRLDTPAQEEREEAALIAAINNERAQRGLGPLAEDALLNGAARAHSREMCALSYFDHHSPTEGRRTPMDRYLAGLRAWGESKPETALVGENIFYAGATDAVYNVAYAHASLMNSSGHRANILEPRFTKVGVGLYRDGQGRFWVTEMFLRDVE